MKRPLGTSPIHVSPLTLGTFAIGGLMWRGNQQQDSIEAIQTAIENGITSIDTAPFYGFGLSEKMVGKAIKKYDRSKVEILTKFGLVWEDDVKGTPAFEIQSDGKNIPIYKNGKKENVVREVENSLQRLQTDYIDLIQLHWPDAGTPIAETIEAMLLLQEQGKIRAFGVSNYSTEQVQEALQTTQIHSNQVWYSMLHRAIEQDLVPFSVQNNIGIIAYSPLERGLLTGKYLNNPQGLSSQDHRNGYFQQFDIPQLTLLLTVLQDLASAKNCSVAQLVLAWTIAQPGITTVLGGARNGQQAAHNAEALQITLTQDDIKLIAQYI
jgi:aryl-alcohol dehydrogenase-like predicted oxidoreductase